MYKDAAAAASCHKRNGKRVISVQTEADLVHSAGTSALRLAVELSQLKSTLFSGFTVYVTRGGSLMTQPNINDASCELSQV